MLHITRRSAAANRVWHIQPSASLLAMISEMSGDQILVGPDRDPGDLDIDDVFGSTFNDALRDLMTDAGIDRGDPRVLLQAVTTPLCDYATRMFHDGELLMEVVEDELRLVGCDFGTLLLQRMADESLARISGMFWGSTLILDPVSGLRGHGYGRDLVMARLMKDESLPTWEHDTPAYSHIGSETVKSAARAILELEARRLPEEPDTIAQEFHP